MASEHAELTGPADTQKPQSQLSPSITWEDVTYSFERAADELQLGEMIHSDSFSLYSAMSAVGLMDPKMDIGCGVVRDVREIQLPSELSNKQVMCIMDQLLACEMSWLDSQTLPQSVFSCVYAQRLSEIPRLELFTFVRLQCATMDTIIKLVDDEKVSDEEDFLTWTHGFKIKPLSPGRNIDDDKLLRGIWEEMDSQVAAASADEVTEIEAIALRVKFRVQFHRAMKYFGGSSERDQFKSAEKILRILDDLVTSWRQCPYTHEVDKQLINLVFDESINRHLLTSSPPRSAPILGKPAAFAQLQNIVKELKAFVKVRKLVFAPADPTHVSLTRIGELHYSLHVALHAAQCYSAEHKPGALTRSLMSRMMLSHYPSSLFGHQSGGFLKLVNTDLGLRSYSEAAQIADGVKLTEGIANLFKLFCRNRGRQRSYVIQEIMWWDQFVSSCYNFERRKSFEREAPSSPDLKASHQTGDESRQKDIGENSEFNLKAASHANGSEIEDDIYHDFTPLQHLSLEIMSRLMIHHWLLGFECDLYQEYEYSAVFFTVGYVLTALTNTTKSLISKLEKGASLHPLRNALFLYDEGCRWICKGLFTVLEAFSASENFNYAGHYTRSSAQQSHNVFGSPELWYEQRFGVFMNLANVPAYADYNAFVSFLRFQEESLGEDEEEKDMVVLRLEEASKVFLTARRALEKAKKLSEICAPNSITEQALKAARVAVENSLAISRLRASQSLKLNAPGSTKPRTVSFNFSRHQHFPVLQFKFT